MRTYQVTITGNQPLLMHNDDIAWADLMEAWKNDKNNKKKSKAGDDRTPAHRWIGCLYRSEESTDKAGNVSESVIVIPTANIMRSIMEGASQVLVPGGKSGKTFKSQSQSGIMPRVHGWPIIVNGDTIPFKPIEKLITEEDFAVHQETVKTLGFDLFMKRARIGTSKHIRVRPRFHTWQVQGELIVNDDQITTSVIQDILEVAGKYKGLCDWRPSSKTPGNYGMFDSVVTQVMKNVA